MVWALLGTLVVAAVTFEIKTSTLESWILARSAAKLNYVLGPGPSDSIVFPRTGPADKTRGYTQLPALQRRMEERGFVVKEQVRFSPQLARLARAGISPPYRDGVAAGLKVIAADGGSLVGVERPTFGSYEEIPNLVARTASYIEDRQLLLAEEGSKRNPVVNWERLFAAGMTYAGGKLGIPVRLQGGSTLATQMEKYLHSPGGRTEGGMEKLRQMAGASLRAYREGSDTRHRRREILLDYLDTMPLGAAPGYGEVSGFAEGLHAWFGMTKEELRRDLHPAAPHDVRARAFKHVIALLCAVRAPSFYLREDRQALMDRIDLYTKLMCEEGFLDPTIATRVPRIPLQFRPTNLDNQSEDKASSIARLRLLDLIGATSLYDLDRMHAVAKTTLDSDLQRQTDSILNCMGDPDFLQEKGLYGEHLLTPSASADPRKVTYTVLLYERTENGDVLRVSTDSSGQPFDLNAGMKMELGSTAKLRTLTHYLEIIAELHKEIEPLKVAARRKLATTAGDPLTRFAAGVMSSRPSTTAEDLLEAALDREYSAAPWEVFFTAGGNHVFHNFEGLDDYKVLPVREAVVRSTNLVFIRLMRDVVRYHTVRLPYDADAVLADERNPDRIRLLKEIADSEAKAIARRRGLKDPVDMAWLFKTAKTARDSRLRTRIERDAFARMTPAWRNLGFPFPSLVPSLATSIGSSADRPAALAELMGIIANGGVRSRPMWLSELRVGPGTPYETVFRPSLKQPDRVLPSSVAYALRGALLGVVERGTARRAFGALTELDGTPLPVGGKTGSGDNRWKKIGRGGGVISSEAYSRTAAFAFFAGERYYGVLTASVFGQDAEKFHFTSALPVSVLTLMAPALNERLVPTLEPTLNTALVASRPRRAPRPLLAARPAPPAERHASAWLSPLRKTAAITLQ